MQCKIWAMTDFTEANGATRLMPDSDKTSRQLQHTIAKTVPAEMSKGSCVLYRARCTTVGGANTSNQPIGLNITYDVGWLRQEENQYRVGRPRNRRASDELLRADGLPDRCVRPRVHR